MKIVRWLQRPIRYLAGTLVILVVCYAVIVVVGREVLPHLDTYRTEINNYISDRYAVKLRTKHISGTWTRLTPRIEIQGLCVDVNRQIPADNPDQKKAGACIDSLSAELDLPGSIVARSLVWRDLAVGTSQITLHEAADGRWSLSDFPAGSGPDGAEEEVISLLRRSLLSRFIGIEKLSVGLQFYSGAEATVDLANIRLESDADFHRLTGGVSLAGNPSSANLVVEARGDIAQGGVFSAEGYLRLNRINFGGSMNAIISQWFPQLVGRVEDIESSLDAEIWLTKENGGFVTLTGQVAAQEIPLWVPGLPPVKNLKANLTGWLKPGLDWGLRWQNLDFEWADQDIKPVDLIIKKGVGANSRRVAIASRQINLAILSRFFTATDLAGGGVSQVLATLEPKGYLQQFHVEVDLDQPLPLVAMRTWIKDLEIQSWAGRPAARGVNGYLSWQESQGFFDLASPDGFAMHYPGVYRDFMEYGSSSGRINIRWRQQDDVLTVAGGPIRINGREGEIRAYLSLFLPLQEGPPPELWLSAGIRNGHSRYSRQYIPDTLNPRLLAWFDRAIGDLDIDEGGFIWRGHLAGKDPSHRSIQVYAKVANGNVAYHPDWPKLEDMRASITVDDGKLQGSVGPARVGRARINQIKVSTHSAGADTLLSVRGAVNTTLADGVQLLLDSPLKQRVTKLSDWQLEGKADVKMDLDIPLGEKTAGGRYRLRARIDDGQMHYSRLGLNINHIDGIVGFSEDKGLYSANIESMIWGHKVQATINTSAGVTRIESKGKFDIAVAPELSPIFSQYVSGVSDYRMVLSIPDEGGSSLRFSSSLQGIEFAYPAPLAKSSDQVSPLNILVSLDDETLVEVELTQLIAARLKFNNYQFTAGQITLGEVEEVEIEEQGAGGLSIVGITPVIDVGHWLDVYRSVPGKQVSPLLELGSSFAINLGELRFRGITLDDVRANGVYNTDGLNVVLDSTSLAGRLSVPLAANLPTEIDLNYLVLPKLQRAGGDNLLAALEPNKLPYLTFATGGLRVGDEELGSVNFLLRPLANGVEITDIEAELIGIEVQSMPDGEPARLIWQKQGELHTSRLAALLKSYDLGGVLQAASLPMVMNSREVLAITDLSWSDAPWRFAAEKLRGQMALNFADGKFFRAPGATSNAVIKIIGLFNFDTWVRRLRLDFSDFFSTGVKYDSLDGGLHFSEGTLKFDQPIVVEMPSGKMRLTGEGNLLNETIDARLVVTLPVGTNLPWIAALVGGLPAAAGVYLTGKLFEKEVNRVSSLGYKITGPWDNPEVAVDRIFSDKTP